MHVFLDIWKHKVPEYKSVQKEIRPRWIMYEINSPFIDENRHVNLTARITPGVCEVGRWIKRVVFQFEACRNPKQP